jgi:hypothetical protein
MANLPPVTYPTTDAPPLALPSQNQSSEARGAPFPGGAPAARISERLAAKSPPLVSTAPTSMSDLQSAQQITLEDLVGHTGGQQLKTGLAALGVLFVLYQLSRRIA